MAFTVVATARKKSREVGECVFGNAKVENNRGEEKHLHSAGHLEKAQNQTHANDWRIAQLSIW